MSDKMREEFEARFPVPPAVQWSEEHHNYGWIKKSAFQRVITYRALWLGWQASRESLAVELPSLHPAMNTACDNYRSWMNCFRACKEAIESLGLRVKS